MKLLLLLTFFCNVNQAFATKIIGNGGDDYALQFVFLAKEVERYLEQADILNINLQNLKEAINSTKVESTKSPLLLAGIPKDAINYPLEKRILFNRARWDAADMGQRPSLVLHEYLGIIGVDDSSYKHSSTLLTGFLYSNMSVRVKGPFIINFATEKEYNLKAQVNVESYGTLNSHYDSSNENIKVTVEFQGKRKVFIMPIKGRVLSAYSCLSREDAGLYIDVLQPVILANGEKEKLREKHGDTYIKHVLRKYLLEFSSKEKDGLPEDVELIGPMSTEAG